MFKRTRITLTAWYLLIIMLVSVSFSAVIYRGITNELNRIERVELIRQQRRLPFPQQFFDPDVVAETKQRVTLMLVAINAAILAGSAVAGYFLAGRTLKPIADMVDEQNRFISDASHELRTPLTALKSEIEVNLRNTNMTLPESKQLLLSNLEEVNNLQTLSDSLMKLTQFTQGNNGLDIASVTIAPVIKEAVRRVSPMAKVKRIAVSVSVPNLTVSGNAVLLTELFIILLDNAVKYSASGKAIRITGKKTDGHAVIHVADEGYGIREEDMPHLFDRFWRADKSRTKTDIHGYGLGLAIGKQIVDHHRGTIAVTSAVKKGTTFTITLPV
jgi:signal transduction histidine kinase